MTDDQAEEQDLLRAVGLETAQSVFLARRKAEEALARAREQLWKESEWLRVTLSSIGDAVVTTDEKGRVLTLNAVAESLTGWTQQDARGRPIGEVFVIVNEATRDPVESPAERALRDGRVVGLANHTLLIARDGTETPIDDSAAPIRDEQGHVHGVVLVFRSIAERKAAEKDLRESERELSDFFDNAAVGLHWVGPDGVILRANQAELDLLGYSRDEYVGRNITEFHADQDVIADIMERLARGEVLRDYEARMRCRDGTIKHVLIDSSARFERDRFLHTRCFTRDVTARRRTERRLTIQHALAQTLAEADDLETATHRILEQVCDHLDWHVGALWVIGADAHIRCYDIYHGQDVNVPQFVAATRNLAFARGEGLPGRVWESGQSVWISDVVADSNFPRAPIAREEGLRSAMAVPLVLNEQVLGVLEFFSSDARAPDAHMLESMTAVGSQVGQFIERHRAGAALRESEERFRTLADKAPVLIWLNSPVGCEFANRSYLDFVGLDLDQVRGMNWAEYVHPQDREDYVGSYVNALRERSVFEREFRFRRFDGVYRHMKTVGVPRFSSGGDFLGFIGSTFDITDIKRAEHRTTFLAGASAALADLTDFRSTLQKVAALAVPQFSDWCAVDILVPDGTLQRLAVAHVDPAKVRHVVELVQRYPSRSSEVHGVREVIRTGESRYFSSIPDETLVALSHDEDHLQLLRNLGLKSYICVPLTSRTQVLGAMTFVTAESGREFDENDVRAAEDLAHRTVIAIENANLLARLKEADRHKDEFLAMLAHELRNPLAPIRNAAELLKVLAKPDSDMRRATTLIDRQVLQMNRLIDDLLDVSRITRGKIELRRELVDLASVVRDAVDASRPLIDKLGHHLKLTLPSEPIRFAADPARLSQVLANLLSNAAKYTNQGGTIELSAHLEDDILVLRVKDNGIGIPASMRERIFELFMQVDRSLERSEGGLGIGLTLVQRLVEMHGGTVECHSAGPGKGSEFIVRIPITDDIVPRSHLTSTTGVRTSTPVPRRVLVVDNNHDAADSMAMLLRMRGDRVHTAYDGEEALQALEAFQPNVVLLDIGLPGMNGYEVAQRIRARDGSAQPLLIAMTGWGQEEDRRRSREAGFDEHLTKPVEFALLMSVLGRGSDGSLDRRALDPDA